MCPFEVRLVSDSRRRLLDLQRRMLAWHAATTVNVHLRPKDQVTIDQLLGKRTIDMAQFKTIAEAIAYVRDNPDAVG